MHAPLPAPVRAREPSGTGIQDLFTPEINSVADSSGDDWTTDNALTEEYDGFKVAGVLNEIDGLDHSGTRHVGTPAVFGMNFQTVLTAQKLPTSDGLAGGYTSAGTPGPLLTRALGSVDAQVGRLDAEIAARGLAASTTVILSAKHGQSPTDPAALRRVDDGPIIDSINAAWAAGHPSAAPLVTFSVDDDVMLLWLSDRSSAARSFVKRYPLSRSAPANTITDPAGTHSATVARSGLTEVYTGKVKKVAEHGGDSADDRDVALVVSGAGAATHRVVSGAVQTTQIAPTILTLLGLNPRSLQAVRQDHTAVLPHA